MPPSKLLNATFANRTWLSVVLVFKGKILENFASNCDVLSSIDLGSSSWGELVLVKLQFFAYQSNFLGIV